jgi:hypothetical protein
VCVSDGLHFGRQDCEPGLLVELVLKLELQVFSPGTDVWEWLCRDIPILGATATQSGIVLP